MPSYPNTKTKVEVPPLVPIGTLFVEVGKYYGKGFKDPVTNRAVSLDDCARGYWRQGDLKSARAYDCKWLAARMDGKIVSIWKIDLEFGWKDSSIETKTTWPSDQPFKRGEKRYICRLLPCDIETQELREKLKDKPVRLGRCFNTLRGYFG